MAQLKLSNIILAAALGAGSTAYAADTVAVAQGNTATNTNTIKQDPRPRVLQETSVRKNGIFTDTVAISTIYEVEEVEYAGSKEPTVFQKSITSDTAITTDVSASSNRAVTGSFSRKVNTYLVSEICEGNRFYGECRSQATKINSRPVAEIKDPEPVAP